MKKPIRWIKKNAPSFLIWTVTVSEKKTGNIVDMILFLTYLGASRFMRDNIPLYSDMELSLILGGERLWLW